MKLVIVILLAFALFAFGCATTRPQDLANGAAQPNNTAAGNNTLAAVQSNGQPSLPNAGENADAIRQSTGAQPENIPEQPAGLPQENMSAPQSPSPQGGEPNMISPEMPPENFTPSPPPPPPPPMPVSPLVPMPA